MPTGPGGRWTRAVSRDAGRLRARRRVGGGGGAVRRSLRAGGLAVPLVGPLMAVELLRVARTMRGPGGAQLTAVGAIALDGPSVTSPVRSRGRGRLRGRRDRVAFDALGASAAVATGWRSAVAVDVRPTNRRGRSVPGVRRLPGGPGRSGSRRCRRVRPLAGLRLGGDLCGHGRGDGGSTGDGGGVCRTAPTVRPPDRLFPGHPASLCRTARQPGGGSEHYVLCRLGGRRPAADEALDGGPGGQGLRGPGGEAGRRGGAAGPWRHRPHLGV